MRKYLPVIIMVGLVILALIYQPMLQATHDQQYKTGPCAATPK